MKRTLALLIAMLTLFSFASAEENHVESVVQMPFTVEMPDVTREGFYTGEVLNGKPHGYGLFTATNTTGINWHYVGEWLNGEMNGQGGCYWDIGYTNVGSFENNTMVDGYDAPVLELEGKELNKWSVEELVWLGNIIELNIAQILETNANSIKGYMAVELSDMNYDELVKLKGQINIAIWNSQEWQEVTVPQGVWKVGEDIPAGHWTVECAEDWRKTRISWGEHLSENNEDIKWKDRYSIFNTVYNPNHKYYDTDDGITSYSFEVCEGDYIVVNDGSCVFMPYAGKPSLGFK